MRNLVLGLVLSAVVISIVQAGCPAAETSSKADAEPNVEPKFFDGKTLDTWRIIDDSIDFQKHGQISIADGVIRLERGQPASGMAWKEKPPKSNYELTFSARRVDGNDFFCGLTFPVKDQFCTLILGGWGGKVVGLSNIDGDSAVENETTRAIPFENGQWYRVKLKVTDEAIQTWLDDKLVIDVETKGHKFSIWWEQEPARPLGLVSWHTTAEVKELKLKRVSE